MKPFLAKPIALLGVCLLVAACSGPSRPKPADIPAVQVLQDMRLKWSTDVGPINFPLLLSPAGQRVAVANAKGQVSLLDASSGKDLWRTSLNTPIAAGVGTDGQQVALVTRAGVAGRDYLGINGVEYDEVFRRIVASCCRGSVPSLRRRVEVER